MSAHGHSGVQGDEGNVASHEYHTAAGRTAGARSSQSPPPVTGNGNGRPTPSRSGTMEANGHRRNPQEIPMSEVETGITFPQGQRPGSNGAQAQRQGQGRVPDPDADNDPDLPDATGGADENAAGDDIVLEIQAPPQAGPGPNHPRVQGSGSTAAPHDKHGYSETKEEREERKKLEKKRLQEAEAEKKRQAEEAKRRQQEEDARRHKEYEDQMFHEISTMKQQIQEYDQAIDQLQRGNHRLREENYEAQKKWNRAEERLEAQRQVLNADRSFASREGTVDAQGLIQAFGDLNSSIGDFSYEVLRSMDEAAESRKLPGEAFQSVYDALQDRECQRFIELASPRELTAMDIVDPIIQYALCRQLFETIFKPFSPGLDQERNSILQTLYDKMVAGQPQERSARWRTITYTHVAADRPSEFIKEAATEFRHKVAKILTALSAGEPVTPESIEPSLGPMIQNIFEAALKVRDKAMKEYVSFDYMVTMPLDCLYDDKRMEVSQGGDDEPSEVLLTVQFGLEARKTVMLGGKGVPELNYPVKATVVCNNWDQNA